MSLTTFIGARLSLGLLPKPSLGGDYFQILHMKGLRLRVAKKLPQIIKRIRGGTRIKSQISSHFEDYCHSFSSESDTTSLPINSDLFQFFTLFAMPIFTMLRTCLDFLQTKKKRCF